MSKISTTSFYPQYTSYSPKTINQPPQESEIAQIIKFSDKALPVLGGVLTFFESFSHRKHIINTDYNRYKNFTDEMLQQLNITKDQVTNRSNFVKFLENSKSVKTVPKIILSSVLLVTIPLYLCFQGINFLKNELNKKNVN